MSMDTEKQHHLKEIRRAHQRRLYELERQAAGYGELAVPPQISIEIKDLREKIAGIDEELDKHTPATDRVHHQYIRPQARSSGNKPANSSSTERMEKVIGFVLPIILAVITALAGYFTAKVTSEPNGANTRATILAEVQPTISALQTAVVVSNVNIPTPTLQNIPSELEQIKSQWKIIIDDNFSAENYNSWVVEDSSFANKTVNDWYLNASLENKYRIEIYGGKNGWPVNVDSKKIKTDSEFYIEADIRKLIGAGKTRYGLIFHFNNVSNERSFYRVSVFDNGAVEVDRAEISPEGIWNPEILFTGKSEINSNDTQKIAVIADHSNYKVYVNNVEIGKFTDSKLNQGTVGFNVTADPFKKTVVEVQRLIVFTP